MSDLEWEKLVEKFKRTTKERIYLAEESFKKGDKKRTRMLLHQIKGSAGSFGFVDISSLVGEIEKLCDAGDYEKAGILLKKLVNMIDHLK